MIPQYLCNIKFQIYFHTSVICMFIMKKSNSKQQFSTRGISTRLTLLGVIGVNEGELEIGEITQQYFIIEWLTARSVSQLSEYK